MNRLIIFLLVVTGLIILSANLSAQESQTRIVFVDSQAAIRAHPAGEASKLIEDQAKTEIDALQADLQAIVEKANSGQQLTAEEQTRFQTLRSTLSSVQQRYTADIAEAVKPALAAVDQVIREVATENDYTLVLDRTVAGPTGINLVVYAKEGLDITPQIIERVRALQ
jgi:Skp family chaperone for outer membrane proteins